MAAFLLILAAGILSGLLISANTVLFLLENYFAPLMAFFIGMVLASTWLLRHEFSIAAWQNVLALLLGSLVSIGLITPRSAELSLLYVFFSGAIAISAMILPGLSGAFILLLLGVYEFILNALIGFDWPYILVFMMGCATGLLIFTRVLSWMLRDHHQLSYGFITRHAAGLGNGTLALAGGGRLYHGSACVTDSCIRCRSCCITAEGICRKTNTAQRLICLFIHTA